MNKIQAIEKLKAKGFDTLPKGMSISDALGKKGDAYLNNAKYDEWITRGRLSEEEREIFDILDF